MGPLARAFCATSLVHRVCYIPCAVCAARCARTPSDICVTACTRRGRLQGERVCMCR